jgi:hypothetical protein
MIRIPKNYLQIHNTDFQRWLMNTGIKFDQLLHVMIREKGKGPTWENVGSILSLLLLEGGEEVGNVWRG